MIRIKASRSEEAFFDAACAGITRMWQAGVTTICDTGSTGAVIAALAHMNASGDAHHEVFGAHPDEAHDAARSLYGDDRVAAFVAALKADVADPLPSLIRDVRAFEAGLPAFDDMAAILLTLGGAPP